MKNELRIKALEVIEALCNEDWVEESLQERMTDIYKYSHCVLCHCKNPHHDWVEELIKIHDKFLKNGML